MAETIKPKKPKRRREMAPAHFLPKELRIGNFHEVNLGYLSLGELNVEADRCYACRKPKCQDACPAGFDIPGMMEDIRNRDYKEAADKVNCFYSTPSSFNRICPGFCQDACIAGNKGDPIQVLNVKRYLADNFPKPKEFYERAPETGKSIAVIGSGPAGVTAAHRLAQKGHDVTVFEKDEILGGMLAVGIPEYRLDNRLLNAEIRDLEQLGVKFITGITYGKDMTHHELFNQGFDAVLVAIGAHKPKFMGIPGEEMEGHIHAIDFLRRVAHKELDFVGKKVIVVGGGDVAIDAVRVAHRLGADAQIVYRRSLEEMPATKPEIHETKVEGININFLTNPVEIVGENNQITGVKLVKMELGEPDDSGRRRPQPIPGSEYIMEADMVIQAISQEPDYHDFENDYQLTRWHTFDVNKETMMTNINGVFAAGDGVSGPATAVEAIKGAMDASEAIHEYIMNKDSILAPGELF